MGTRIASVSGLRGIIGDGLDPTDVTRFSAAYAAGCAPGPILVGHDGRRTAPMMVQAVLAGLTASGRRVVLLGPLATPTLGVQLAETASAGGIQISASHNPPEYNGLKFFQPGGMVLGPEQGRAMLQRFERQEFSWVSWDRVGNVTTPSSEAAELTHLLRVDQIIDREAIRKARFKVVLDGCHGGGGRLGTRLLRDWLGSEVRALGIEPDGLYDHPPEPTETNLQELSKIVPAIGAAVGFAQDPDADRLAIIDETGRYIGEELTLALAVLQRLQQQKQKGPVVLNLSTSRTAEEIAKRHDCPVFRTPVGEIHVVQRMQAEQAILGGEGNGGVIDPRVGFVRDSFVGMALVLDLMATTGKPLSQLVDSLPRFAMVKEKYPLGEVPIADLFDRISQAHPNAEADRRDGLRLDWPEGWVHVRASNTEPIVRVIVEAKNQEWAQERADAMGRWVASGDVS